jgi:hypothetical protein
MTGPIDSRGGAILRSIAFKRPNGDYSRPNGDYSRLGILRREARAQVCALEINCLH